MIHKATHTLVLNSELIKSNYLDGKLSLLHFLFCYAKKHNKPHYNNYAFETLEFILAKELSAKAQINRIGIVGIGYGIIDFVEHSFFESDDIDEILSIVDHYAFTETERLSRTNFDDSYISDLALLGHYFLHRLKYVKKGTALLKLKEHLQVVFFELCYNPERIKTKDKHVAILCMDLFKKSMSDSYVGHFSKKCYDESLSNSGTHIYKNLLIDLGMIRENTTLDSGKLINEIEVQIQQRIKNLYSGKVNDVNDKLLEILVLNNVLLNEDMGSELIYMINITNKLPRNQSRKIFSETFNNY